MTSKFFFCLLPFLMASCSHGDKNAESASSQIVAKVNDGEISVHQLNLWMAKSGNVEPSKMKLVAKQSVDQLVDLELLKQQAVKEKLDRVPKVLRLIEQSKMQILAQAYIDKVATPEVADDLKVNDFYEKHPELFSQRKNYQMQQLLVAASTEQINQLESLIRQSKTIDQIKQWLMSENIKVNAVTLEKFAEQLPADVLGKLYKMQPGQLLMVKNAGSAILFELDKAELMPVSLKEASGPIKMYLANAQRAEKLKQVLSDLHQKSTITYMGEFAKDAASKDAPKDSITQQSQAQSPAPNSQKGLVEKGISGL